MYIYIYIIRLCVRSSYVETLNTTTTTTTNNNDNYSDMDFNTEVMGSYQTYGQFS